VGLLSLNPAYRPDDSCIFYVIGPSEEKLWRFIMSGRFFVDSPISGNHATLAGAEAHHLAHVMRAKPGDRLMLFDGSGFEFAAQIESIGKAQVELTVLGRLAIDRESSMRLTLAVALPKGDRQRWLIEKAGELGVANLVPLITQRGVAQPSASAVARLQRTAIEAAKQCGRNRLLEIAQPQRWGDYLSAAVAAVRWLAHPGGKSLPASWPTAGDQAPPSSVIAAVGPEGGFTDEEVAQAIAAGWQMVDLGPRILRVETAAAAVAAWVSLAHGR
jgi:16S rRNA (uracil1498-N3)-methyltransferase